MPLSGELQRKLEKDGYVVSNARLDKETIKNLALFYEQYSPGLKGFHTSFDLQSIEVKRRINNHLKQVLKPHVDNLFPNYHLVVANFVVKEPSPESYLPFHRDWSVLNEQRYSGYNVWFPLIDLNNDNGVIGFCKGTHKNAPLFRSPTNPTDLVQTSPQLENKVEFQYAKAGQLLVFNHGTIHCSKANRSIEPRVAVTAVIIPKASKGRHYYFKNNGADMVTYEVDEEFYLQYQIDSAVPEGLQEVKKPRSLYFNKLISYFKW